tara:strand:+ start:174 stop:926 length:753 start_codon:yes stop_codon:yes gene_type:complete
MKNIILLLSLMLSLSTSAQYARMIAVDLKEGGEKEYLELEKFWSQVHEEAVKNGLHNGWSIWKRTPKSNDQESAAEYFIFESYSSLEQFENGYNPLELAQEAYKGKMSRRAINRYFNNSDYDAENERRTYILEGVSATILAGGNVKVGDVATINVMSKKTDDFENYETIVWKPIAEDNILKGNIRQWILAKVVQKSDNAYDWSHMAWNLRTGSKEYDVPSGFEWDKMWEGINSSRDMMDSTELTLVYAVE